MDGARDLGDSGVIADNRDEQLEALYKSLVRPLPTSSPIFLPTEKIPLEEKVRGMRHVTRIYAKDLDSTYRPRLRALRDACSARQRCFVIGNGPSLNRTDLTKLAGEVTFAVNGFFLKAPELGWTPTFYVVEDHLVAEDRKAQIDAFKGPIKLFPAYLGYCFDASPDTIFYNHLPRKSYPRGFDFSTDAAKATYTGCTVTFSCLQLAYYLGFKEIYLIGVDADYALPKDVEKQAAYGVGVLDMKSDDPNHFDPNYFGKGYRWHDPQVEKMVDAYQEARKVAEANNCQILNATVGGKLEVFKRVSYDSLFPATSKPSETATPDASVVGEFKSLAEPDFPRLLVIDHTLSGNGTATGEVKRALFRNWPADKLLQFHSPKPRAVGVDGLKAPRGFDPDNLSIDDAMTVANGFAPQAILYRPVPNQAAIHDAALAIIDRLDVPLIIWMMDDWPAFQELEKSSAFPALDRDLRRLLKQAKLRLSICDSMSDAFSRRYGVPFKAYANGIDPDDWNFPRQMEAKRKHLLVRYAGSLAENMTLESVIRIAAAVEELNAEGVLINFEIKTSPYWSQLTASRFKKFKHTSITDAFLSETEYRQWLAAGDVNIIAYNFDARSLAYVKYSLANKLPECLASGAALLVHGPKGLPTVDLVAERECGSVVSSSDLGQLKSALRGLVSKPERDRLSARARAAATADHDIRKLRESLRVDITDVAAPNPNSSESAHALTAAYPPAANVRVDETEVVSTLFPSGDGRDRVMIDVGAHVGSSAKYFAAKGWTVHCFEPDPVNREALTKHFGSNPKVTIDPRAVGDTVTKGQAFFKSEESSGISSLLPFRDTHKEAAQVDVTTVAEIVRDRGLKKIDFLKIDVEGWDFSVLKGVPWDTLRPSVIECEFEDAKTNKMGFTYRDIANYLVAHGYTVYVSEWHPIVRYGVPHKWYRLKLYPCGLAQAKGWGNLLAYLEDPGAEKLAGAFEACLKVHTPAAAPKPAAVTPVAVESKAKEAIQSKPEAVQTRAKENVMNRLSSFRSRTGQWLRTKHPAYYGLALDAERAVFRLADRPVLMTAIGVAILSWLYSIVSSGLDQWPNLIVQAVLLGIALYAMWQVQKDADEITANSRRVEKLSTQFDGTKEEVASFGDSLRSFDDALKRVTNHLRLVTPESEKVLERKWAKLLGVQATPVSLDYLARRIQMLEGVSSGRLATSIENAILRCLVARSVKGKQLRVLEIGSLFGIGLSMIYDSVRGQFDDIHITAMDPLSGFYSVGTLDTLLKIPVCKEIFWHNMRIADIPQEHLTLIDKLSTAPEALEQAARIRYDLLVIDGDHSYEGVKFDYDNYIGLVEDGGYIVIDDYGSKAWPDVTRFVDTVVKDDPRVELVGTDWTTAVFRVRPRGAAA